MSNGAAPIMGFEQDAQLSLALFIHGADDADVDSRALNLADELSLHSSSGASFMRDSSMSSLGIYEGDLLLIDRKRKPQHEDIVLYRLEGDLACRKLDLKKGCLYSSDQEEMIFFKDHVGLTIEGVVRHIIHSLR